MKKTILSFLASLKLTIALLIIIAAFSILGTIIPQQYSGGESFRHLSPGLAQVFMSLQLFDMYHSVWFIMLMCLLSLNLIACSVDRFSHSWKLFKKIPSPDRSKPFENLPPENTVSTETARDAASSGVETLMRKRYKRVKRKDSGTTTSFYGDKGALSHFGVYIIHASILIVIAGAIIGSLFGFNAVVNIPEGESTNQVYLTRHNGTTNLDFTVRCDDFSIAFYKNGMPKEFRSNLSFLENNTVLYQGPLLVNHPITVRGIRFYQASYGNLPGDRVTFTVTKNGEEPHTITARLKDSFGLPGSEAMVTLERIEENLMSMGPAARIKIVSPEKTMSFWVFQHIARIKQRVPDLFSRVPKFNPGRFQPYHFALTGLEQRYYTGLQLSRDPGVPIVGVGALCMIVGLLFTFFSSHKRLWVRVDERAGKTAITVAATSNRDPVGLERETKHLLKHLSAMRGYDDN